MSRGRLGSGRRPRRGEASREPDGARISSRHQAARSEVDLVDACFSDGRRVAFFESPRRQWAVPESWSLWTVLAREPRWRKCRLLRNRLAPSGDEVWFSGARSDGPPSDSRRVALRQRADRGARAAPLKLDDISRDGRVLVTKGLNLGGITCLIPGETREREVGWLDNARRGTVGRRQDGSLSLIRGSWRGGVYTRGRTDHPRSDWVTATRVAVAGRQVGAGESAGAETMWGREWVLVPTGPGAPIAPPRIDHAVGQRCLAARWKADCVHRDRGPEGARYVQDVETGSMRPITPAGVHMPEKAATPDGKSVLVWLDGKWFLYPIDGGQPRPMFRCSALR